MSTLADLFRGYVNPNWNNADPLQSVKLGVGFDTFHCQTMAQALDPSAATKNTHATASESRFLSTGKLSEISQSLGLTVDAGFSAVTFSAKDSLSFMDASQFNSYDFFALAYIKIRLPSDILNGGPLTVRAQHDAKSMTQKEFFKKYGDYFVSRIDYGADLFGLLHVHCESASQKTSLSNDFKGSGPGVTLDAKLNTAYSSMSKVGNVETIFMKSGGQPGFVDPAAFIAAVKAFPQEVEQVGGSPFGFGVASYDVSDWPEAGKKKADFGSARGWVAQQLALIVSCEGLLNDAGYIADARNQRHFDYSVVTLQTVQGEIQTIQNVINVALAVLKQISDNPVDAKTAPATHDLRSVVFPPARTMPPPALYTFVGVFG